MDGRWPAMIVIIIVIEVHVRMWSSNSIGEGGDVPTVLLAALRGHSRRWWLLCTCTPHISGVHDILASVRMYLL